MNKFVLIGILVGSLAIIIGFLVTIGLEVYRTTELEKNTKFPPWPAKCPDYWTNMGDDVCQNTHRIGDCYSGETDNNMDFGKEAIYQNTRGMYYKCNWSKKCNTPWEGIENLC